MIDRQALRSPPTGIQAVQLASACFPVDSEEIAAHSIRHGLGNAQDGIGRDSRINGGSALFQYSCARLRSLHIAGRHNAIGSPTTERP